MNPINPIITTDNIERRYPGYDSNSDGFYCAKSDYKSDR